MSIGSTFALLADAPLYSGDAVLGGLLICIAIFVGRVAWNRRKEILREFQPGAESLITGLWWGLCGGFIFEGVRGFIERNDGSYDTSGLPFLIGPLIGAFVGLIIGEIVRFRAKRSSRKNQ